MLAEKIYKIQKELEEKRRTRRQQISQQSAAQGGQQPPPPQGPGSVSNPSSVGPPNAGPAAANSTVGSQPSQANNQNNILGPASNMSNYNGEWLSYVICLTVYSSVIKRSISN